MGPIEKQETDEGDDEEAGEDGDAEEEERKKIWSLRRKEEDEEKKENGMWGKKMNGPEFFLSKRGYKNLKFPFYP